jgi:shikimate kinase
MEVTDQTVFVLVSAAYRQQSIERRWRSSLGKSKIILMKKHIYLIGFMGTGKTTIGRELAKQLQIPWIDLDDQFIKVTGYSIPEFFQEFGEEDFRLKEAEILQACADLLPHCISTGGGIVLKEKNRHFLQETGWVIQLRAEPEVILQRIAQDRSTVRPLLQQSTLERIHRLLQERKGKYDFADYTVDTSHITVEEVVREIMGFLQGRFNFISRGSR